MIYLYTQWLDWLVWPVWLWLECNQAADWMCSRPALCATYSLSLPESSKHTITHWQHWKCIKLESESDICLLQLPHPQTTLSLSESSRLCLHYRQDNADNFGNALNWKVRTLAIHWIRKWKLHLPITTSPYCSLTLWIIQTLFTLRTR